MEQRLWDYFKELTMATAAQRKCITKEHGNTPLGDVCSRGGPAKRDSAVIANPVDMMMLYFGSFLMYPLQNLYIIL